MRAYMPRGHRRFLNALEEADGAIGGSSCPSIRAYIAALKGSKEEEKGGEVVVAAYDACIEALVAFRRAHLSIVQTYILRQQQQQQQQAEGEGGGEGERGGEERGQGLEKAAGGKGTGGMPLLAFLVPLKEETEAARLKSKGIV
jgi:hypothetical protein